MALSSAAQLLAQLASQIQSKAFDDAQKTLTQGKILLTQLPNLTSPQADAAAVKERETARGILEQAVLLSAFQDDRPGFQRNMTQLKIYYFDYRTQLTDSELRNTVLALNLLYLLTESRLAEFHSELGLLAAAERAAPAAAFVAGLEEALMMGSYGRALDLARGGAPAPAAAACARFLASLTDTVREAVAEARRRPTPGLSLGRPAKRLPPRRPRCRPGGGGGGTAGRGGAGRRRPEWTVAGGRIAFGGNETKSKSSEIPSLRVISETLSYATELERIV
ncbi:unnamed protein product [Heterosigma akashiwo]